jgi:hypothetical protein
VNGPNSIVVPVKWPSVEPIHVQSLVGRVRAPGAVPGRIEQSIWALGLLNGISGQVLASLNTAGRGDMDFGNVEPGI